MSSETSSLLPADFITEQTGKLFLCVLPFTMFLMLMLTLCVGHRIQPSLEYSVDQTFCKIYLHVAMSFNPLFSILI